MTDVLIESCWSAGESLLLDRVAQSCASVGEIFPTATYWKLGHKRDFSAQGEFKADSPDLLALAGGTLSSLLRASVQHLKKGGLDANYVVVNAAAYSEALDLSVRVFANEPTLSIEAERDKLKAFLGTPACAASRLLRNLGACPAIDACWLRKRSVFAGAPEALYAPRSPFAKLCDPLEYRGVVTQVHTIRARLRAKLADADLPAALRDAGLQTEPLAGGRLYVELGDPLGAGGGAALRKLEPWFRRLLA